MTKVTAAKAVKELRKELKRLREKIAGVPRSLLTMRRRGTASVVQASVSVAEKVARARSLFKTPRKPKRPKRRTESTPRNTRHPQD